jgi:hypothetical protein
MNDQPEIGLDHLRFGLLQRSLGTRQARQAACRTGSVGCACHAAANASPIAVWTCGCTRRVSHVVSHAGAHLVAL